jgi:hypothetical protein
MSGMAMDCKREGERKKRTKGKEGEEIRLGDCAASERGTRDRGWETQNRGVWEVLFWQGTENEETTEQSRAEIDQGGWALALRDDGSRYRPAGAGPGTVAGTVQGPLAGSRAGEYGAACRRACTGTRRGADRGCHATGALRRVSRQGRDMPFSSCSCSCTVL